MGKTKFTAKANFEKTTLSDGLITAKQLEKELEDLCQKVTIAGSIRQGKEMVGDIDIVVIPKDSIDEFVLKVKDRIQFEYGGTKKLFGMYKDRPVNIFLTTPDSYGACLYQSTGPAMYNIHIRKIAKSKGFKLNEYGLYQRETDVKVAGSTEESIFEALGMDFKNPTDRKAPEWIKK